jgi:hypothetical protein
MFEGRVWQVKRGWDELTTCYSPPSTLKEESDPQNARQTTFSGSVVEFYKGCLTIL